MFKNVRMALGNVRLAHTGYGAYAGLALGRNWN